MHALTINSKDEQVVWNLSGKCHTTPLDNPNTLVTLKYSFDYAVTNLESQLLIVLQENSKMGKNGDITKTCQSREEVDPRERKN